MKFVKANLFLIISGVIALLAIGAYFWPLGSKFNELKESMTARVATVNAADQLTNNTIEMPGGVTIKGPVTPNVIIARDHAQEYMKDQAKQIVDLASNQNQAGRVVVKAGHYIPLLDGQEQDGYLPKLDVAHSADPHDFKFAYAKVTEAWPVRLSGTDKIVATAPTQAEITEAMAKEAAARAANAPTVFGHPAPDVFGGNAPDAKQIDEYTRRYVANRAGAIRMYVTMDAFPREAWVTSSAAPNEAQIFEALVRYWLTQDVVKAIAAVNVDASGQPTRDVGVSGIKQLEKVQVGNGDASSGLFIIGVNGSKGTAAPSDVTRSITGRVGTKDTLYDVTQITINMVLDPAKLNAFIDQLYRQNNGYTVLNVKQTTVDPFQAASEGYLYGETQCVHVEIQVEALLFRKWTVPIMPDAVRTQLGLPLVSAAAAPAPKRVSE